MCKILDSMVLAHLSMGGGEQTKQDRERSDDLRRETGNRTIRVVTSLYEKGTFDCITGPMKRFKTEIRDMSLGTDTTGGILIPVKVVAKARACKAKCDVEMQEGFSKIRAPGAWDEIIAKCRAMRGSNFDRNDYPLSPPLEKWFFLDFKWLPHPRESAFSSAMRETSREIEDAIRQEMIPSLNKMVETARNDLMSRVADSLGGFVRKCQRLRSETRTCEKCKFQWIASTGDVCKRCGTVQPTVNAQETRVFESTIESVRELAATLGAVIPDEYASEEDISNILRPVTSLTSDDLRATAPVLIDYEYAARDSADKIARLVNSTFV